MKFVVSILRSEIDHLCARLTKKFASFPSYILMHVDQVFLSLNRLPEALCGKEQQSVLLKQQRVKHEEVIHE